MKCFASQIRRDGLKFDYSVGDAVALADSRRALITGYGVYDNQYWCEVAYPDGVHLCAGDYFTVSLYEPYIIEKLSDTEAIEIAYQLKTECDERGGTFEERYAAVNHLISTRER